jgi:hypothetical protein
VGVLDPIFKGVQKNEKGKKSEQARTAARDKEVFACVKKPQKGFDHPRIEWQKSPGFISSCRKRDLFIAVQDDHPVPTDIPSRP